MYDYKVYFRDGNKQIFKAFDGMYSIVSYLCFTLHYSQEDFYKIEEV